MAPVCGYVFMYTSRGQQLEEMKGQSIDFSLCLSACVRTEFCFLLFDESLIKDALSSPIHVIMTLSDNVMIRSTLWKILLS